MADGGPEAPVYWWVSRNRGETWRPCPGDYPELVKELPADTPLQSPFAPNVWWKWTTKDVL